MIVSNFKFDQNFFFYATICRCLPLLKTHTTKTAFVKCAVSNVCIAGFDTVMMMDCREAGGGVGGGVGVGGGGGGGVIAGPGAGGTSPPSMLREQFAKVCFETLLQFSLVDGISSPSSPPPQHQPPPSQPPSSSSSSSVATTTVPEAAAALMAAAAAATADGSAAADAELITGKLAVTALLHRFQEVVEKFCHDQNLTGKCPLPRSVFVVHLCGNGVWCRAGT